MVLRTMFGRLRNRFKFFVERMLLRGAHYRLLVIAVGCGPCDWWKWLSDGAYSFFIWCVTFPPHPHGTSCLLLVARFAPARAPGLPVSRLP